MTTGKDEFIQILTEQIRCVKARSGVAREFADHIEDQTEYYEAKGMEHETAVREAVRQMGDPIDVGTQLDLIHRPQTDWRMIFLIVLCSLGGLAVQYATGALSTAPGMVQKQCLYMAVGLVIMTGIYFLDYGFIGIYAKELFVLMALLYGFGIVLLVPQINGTYRAAILPMYLFVPVYAGILYRYRGEGMGGVVRSILWIFIPVGISWKMIPSLPTAMNLFLICGIMVLTAVAKGWFVVDRKKMFALIIGVGVVLPVLFAAFSYSFLMLEYQKARIEAFLNPVADPWGRGYVVNRIREMLTSEGLGLFAGVPGANRDFVSIDTGYCLIQLVVSYGLLFGFAVIAALAKVIALAFRTSFRQKNQLGFMISFGCGLIFLVMTLEGIAMNFSLIPGTTVILPFVSHGGAAVIVYDILLGLLLAIYRYQNVLDEVKYSAGWKHKPGWRIRLRLQIEKTD